LIKEPQIQAISKLESSLSKTNHFSLDFASNQPEKLRQSPAKEQIGLPQKLKPKFYLNKEESSTTGSESSSDSDTYT